MSDLLRCFCNRSRGHGRVFGDRPAEVPEGPIAFELHGVARLHYVGLWFMNPQSVSLAKMPLHAGSCCVLPFLESLQETLKNGRGKFLGFAKSISDCKTKYACPTQTRQRETVQAYEPCSNIQHACEPTVVRYRTVVMFWILWAVICLKRWPQEALGVPEVAKWRSADCVPNTAHGTPRCLVGHDWDASKF